MTKQQKLLASLEQAYRKNPTPALLAKINRIKERQKMHEWLGR